MSVAQNHDSGFRFTGWHMLACMLAFFGVIIAVNFTMAFMASGTWTGLVVKNSYVASQKFNDELALAKQQTENGLRSTISYTGDKLSFRIIGDNGNSVRPKEAVIWLGRPAFEQQDRTLTAVCDRTGMCSASVQLAAGHWAVRFEAALPNGAYRRDARLFVTDGGKVRLD